MTATKTCDWCEEPGPITLQVDGEGLCAQCAPYAWAAHMHPETKTENRRIALDRGLARAEPYGIIHRDPAVVAALRTLEHSMIHVTAAVGGMQGDAHERDVVNAVIAAYLRSDLS